MVVNDPISDMLTRIRNGCMARTERVTIPASKMKTAIAEVLRDNGYITEYETKDRENNKRDLFVTLKYRGSKIKEPVIEGLERVSKPSRRVYAGSEDIPYTLGGFGVTVLSTSKGIMSDHKAREENIGGEVLCKVW